MHDFMILMWRIWCGIIVGLEFLGDYSVNKLGVQQRPPPTETIRVRTKFLYNFSFFLGGVSPPASASSARLVCCRFIRCHLLSITQRWNVT